MRIALVVVRLLVRNEIVSAQIFVALQDGRKVDLLLTFAARTATMLSVPDVDQRSRVFVHIAVTLGPVQTGLRFLCIRD